MSEQRDLYLFNRARLQDPRGGSAELLAVERAWIASRMTEAGDPAARSAPRDLESLRERLAELIELEASEVPASARYVGEAMPLAQFRVLVEEFAVDGLTEAQVFYYVLPRLTLEAQMPMLRIMIDEFGSGNLKRAHTTLYVRLLEELGLPTELDYFAQRVSPACLEFVNLFFWLTLRADDPSYFAGAITYLETVIPTFFACYVQACERLGVAAHHYYSEHRHIDVFHALEGHRLLRAMHDTGTLAHGKAWAGARLASCVTAVAFEAAVARARTASPEAT